MATTITPEDLLGESLLEQLLMDLFLQDGIVGNNRAIKPDRDVWNPPEDEDADPDEEQFMAKPIRIQV